MTTEMKREFNQLTAATDLSTMLFKGEFFPQSLKRCPQSSHFEFRSRFPLSSFGQIFYISVYFFPSFSASWKIVVAVDRHIIGDERSKRKVWLGFAISFYSQISFVFSFLFYLWEYVLMMPSQVTPSISLVHHTIRKLYYFLLFFSSFERSGR